jgi:hypothetical protein
MLNDLSKLPVEITEEEILADLVHPASPGVGPRGTRAMIAAETCADSTEILRHDGQGLLESHPGGAGD